MEENDISRDGLTILALGRIMSDRKRAGVGKKAHICLKLHTTSATSILSALAKGGEGQSRGKGKTRGSTPGRGLSESSRDETQGQGQGRKGDERREECGAGARTQKCRLLVHCTERANGTLTIEDKGAREGFDDARCRWRWKRRRSEEVERKKRLTRAEEAERARDGDFSLSGEEWSGVGREIC
ncbi:hypothetical protein Mp_1g17620 [Marchantia polymorpha subsp. ruderalis]|uniref:Uncharacterized protein n=2 Tax=Marchantia polymorpha TaxID=3197 RepID=A0A176WAZ0_MARPO|nr:hypothetical protein AXG93_773s1120 [Marchantia polymorpha subsp. ruderalis]PTQ50044.1 hypothetical protein MARPO_0001s0102 [Marchantia polymorpha]BBM98967.1 hypothetical protein Mp_1g17620 [Marchantia polymorpha subsp. ruderalis]|eukprot:PTQ50044.1 hypothetical protein MARPO_0001s0102 [Marchantia polymorpha]